MAHRKEGDGLQKVASIVLAGGQGTRLYPLTATRCKPSVAFGGRYRLIDIPLSNSLNAKINQIFVISQYFIAELHQHILSTYQLDTFRSGGIELLSPQETGKGKSWFKGTADAIRQNLDYLLKFPVEYFLILSGDQLYNMNLQEMVEFAKHKDADLVIAALPVEEPEAKRMGVLKVNGARNILDFYEKPQELQVLKEYQLPQNFFKEQDFSCNGSPHWLGSMGIYIFKREALAEILQLPGDDFGRHLIPKYIRKSKSAAYLYKGYWEDIGTVGSYYRANLILTELGQGLNVYDMNNPIYSRPHHVPGPHLNGTRITKSILNQGCIIEAEEITHSIIGLRAKIKKGTIIRDSIVVGNKTYAPEDPTSAALPKDYFIGQNCLIERAIIDEQTCIGNNVRLINKNKMQHYDGDGIFIRDGIIIVTSGTSIPDHFVL